MTFLREEEVFPTADVIDTSADEEVADTAEAKQSAKRKLPDNQVEEKVVIFCCFFSLSLSVIFFSFKFSFVFHNP